MRIAEFGVRNGVFAITILVVLGTPAFGAELDAQSGRMIERALQQLEDFRKELPTLQYDAAVLVKEWNGSGRLRGTAKAVMTVRPGDAHPVTYLSREVHGKVKLPDENDKSNDDDKDKTTLQDFSREHRINERFDFTIADAPEPIAAGPARRIEFTPKPNQPEKNTADRFLDSVDGKAWIAEERNRLAKFEMRLRHPFQLFWIFAVLKELSIDYELLEPKEFLGHARLTVRFCLATPIYTLRQQHDVELDHFRKREMTVAQH
jgi:hypothetical protein